MKYLLILALLFFASPAHAQLCIGSDGGESVEIRASADETFSVFLGGDLRQSIEQKRSTFYVPVSAPYFVPSPPVFVSTDVKVSDESTLIVAPNGSPLVVAMPVAFYEPGRIVTIKVVGPGGVYIEGSYSPYLGGNEHIDADNTLFIPGSIAGTQRAVTLQAWARPWPWYTSGWIVIASYP